MGRKSKRVELLRKVSAPAARYEQGPVVAASYGLGEAALFSLTLFISAMLLFIVEPMFAKMVLPLLGGAPAVWNACLVFYQAALLAGYLYAHLSLKWLGPRRQAVLHMGLLSLAWLVLPIHVAHGWIPPATTFPAPWLWLLLAVSLGLPFLAVSASAPMLQAWFAQTSRQGARDPYFLYAASNLGSLLALLAYPLVIEGQATLSRQSGDWAIGYGVLMALVAACAARLWTTPKERKRSFNREPAATAGAADNTSRALAAGSGLNEGGLKPTLRRRLYWLALSLVPSSLLMGVTTYISSELPPRPYLWIVPLGLYLLTFVLVFAQRTILPLRWMVRLQPPLVVAVAATLLCNGTGLLEVAIFGTLHLATFFVTAMVCHGQLAADRPAPSQLTEFYLWMSLGGVAGGLLNALVAPVIFKSVLEYPLMIAAACLLRPRMVAGTLRVPSAGSPRLPQEEPAAEAAGRTAHDPQAGTPCLLLWRERLALPATALLLCLVVAWGLRGDSFLSGWRFTDSPTMHVAVLGVAAFAAFLLRRRPAVFAAAVAALAAISLWSLETGTRLCYADRSFFGILRVEHDPVLNVNQLLNGTTIHGQQSLAASRRHEPQSYYHRTGPLGRIFEVLQSRRPLAEVGILGLGVGGIAAYAQPGERFTFYEIDPAVERIARNPDYFSFLTDCRGKVDVILGDARLSLKHGPQRNFDLLILDVFSSDAVPVHLITREAFEIYRKRLNPGGILVIHISSRYFNLEPVLGNLARAAGLTARLWRDNETEVQLGKFASAWVVMGEGPAALGALAADRRWQPLACDAGPVWTDDFSNVAGTLQWHSSSGLHLIPGKWNKLNPAEAHALLAMALLGEHKYDEAIEHFQKSVEIEPNNAGNHYALGYVLAEQGRTDEAIEHYEAALSLDPNLPKAHSDLGVTLDRKGEKDKALDHFRQAVAIAPYYVDGLHNLGKALLDRRQYDEGEDCFRKAAALKPGSARIRFDLGLALARQETQAKVDEALGEFRRALPLAVEEDAELVEKIKAEIRRCEKWPWEEEKK